MGLGKELDRRVEGVDGIGAVDCGRPRFDCGRLCRPIGSSKPLSGMGIVDVVGLGIGATCGLGEVVK